MSSNTYFAQFSGEADFFTDLKTLIETPGASTRDVVNLWRYYHHSEDDYVMGLPDKQFDLFCSVPEIIKAWVIGDRNE